jgi:hypothetical protein
MWLSMALLGAVAIFIVWDSRRLRRTPTAPVSREAMDRGYVPRGFVAWHFWLGMGVMFALMAMREWELPSMPPFTGRWGWLDRVAFEAFGAKGVFVLFTVAAVGAIAYGLMLQR